MLGFLYLWPLCNPFPRWRCLTSSVSNSPAAFQAWRVMWLLGLVDLKARLADFRDFKAFKVIISLVHEKFPGRIMQFLSKCNEMSWGSNVPVPSCLCEHQHLEARKKIRSKSERLRRLEREAGSKSLAGSPWTMSVERDMPCAEAGMAMAKSRAYTQPVLQDCFIGKKSHTKFCRVKGPFQPTHGESQDFPSAPAMHGAPPMMYVAPPQAGLLSGKIWEGGV